MDGPQDKYFESVVIDSSSKKPIDKEYLLNLLKFHNIDTSIVESAQIKIEDVIPYIHKAKIKLPEAFYKDLALKVNMSFVDNSRVTEIYQKKIEVNLSQYFHTPL